MNAVRAACILAVYLAFLTKTYYWDGVLFSLNIESAAHGQLPVVDLFHPNHLIYTAFGYGIYSAMVRIAPGVRAITVLQVSNVLLSVLAGYALFLLARRITNSDRVAFFSWLLFAAGATWWKFSTDADSYIVSVLLLLLATLSLLNERPRIVLAALCHAAAMLFHELAIFAYVPVLTWIWLDARMRMAAKLSTALTYCAGTGIIVGFVYWLCYQQNAHGASPTLLSWVTSYSADKGFTHSFSDVFVHYLTSYLKLFAGGKLMLIAQFFSVWVCLALVLCALFVICGIRRLAASLDHTEVDRRALIFFWVWLGAYAVFLGLWDPGSAFHKLFLWPAIVLLIGVYGRARIRSLTFFAAALAAWNFAAYIYPHAHASADPVLVLAQKLDRELPKNAVVYYRVLDPDDWYLQYFAPGRSWRQLPIAGGNGGPVCLDTTALEAFDGAIEPNMKWDLVNASHNVRLECLKNAP
ncbi:MAG: hypothetical protein JO051_05715 [Acidobacteriaceae bacterium]|nr:hypothetical protein [Acidobacteriaceae bacterium]